MRRVLFSIFAFTCLVSCGQPLSPAPQLLSETIADIRAGDSNHYSIEYNGNTPILVTVSAFEATVESRISDDTGQLLNQAYFDFRRGVPLFQLLQPTGQLTRLQVDIDINRATINSFLEIRAFALPSQQKQDQKRIEAYRLYSDAVQREDSYDQAVWEIRMQQFQHASVLFEQLGLENENLWSEFLAAVLAYFPVADVETSLLASEDLFERARDLGQIGPAVMALQLNGQSLMYKAIDSDQENSAQNIQQAIAVFEETSNYAKEMGQDFQHSWALNNIGVAHYYMDEFEQAIAGHQAGLEAGNHLVDQYLNDVLNSNIAAAMQGQGDYEGVTETLLKITESQRLSKQTMELAFSLDRLGHTYAKLYQFDKAVAAYSEALEIAMGRNDLEMAGLISVSLGDAYFELGYFENALQYSNKAIELLEPSTFNGGFGLRTAHAIAAKIYRLMGDTVNMETHRQKQAHYGQSDLDSAQYSFEHAIDTLSVPNHSANSAGYFEQAYFVGKKLSNKPLILLSQMHLCLQGALGKEQCNTTALGRQIDEFASSAKPREKLEALKLWADFLILQNRQNEAMTVLLGLLDEIQFYRSNLSGVMGAWYWQSRTDVFQKLMHLQITMDQQSGDGTASFVLLNRLHTISSGDITLDQGQRSDHSYVKIRSLMAQLDEAGTNEQRTNIEHRLEFELLKLPATDRTTRAALNAQGMAGLQALLPHDASILAFYFSDSGVFSWVADSKDIRLTQISTDGSLAAEIGNVMGGLRVIGNDTLYQQLDLLGMQLLAPVMPFLKETTYFMPGGPLNGFPIDVLRYEGVFFAENHIVVNLQSLDSLEGIFVDQFKDDMPLKVLLAGNPLLGKSTLPELKGSLSEIEAIANVLVSGDITQISGAQFNRDLIGSELFSSASLIHIASHGILNLKYPELSAITLSKDNSPAGDFLIPQELSSINISAELVVLSACETGGLNSFQFDSNLGFVSEFLAKGSNNVIASLFPVSDVATADFMIAYYAELNRSKSFSRSLALTKRKYIKTLAPRDWAAFQLNRK